MKFESCLQLYNFYFFRKEKAKPYFSLKDGRNNKIERSKLNYWSHDWIGFVIGSKAYKEDEKPIS